MEVMISPEIIIALMVFIEKQSTDSTSSSCMDRLSNSFWETFTEKIDGNMGKRLGEITRVFSGTSLELSVIDIPVSSLSSRSAASSGPSFCWTPPAGSYQTAPPRIFRKTLGIITDLFSRIGRTITCWAWYTRTLKSSFSRRENLWFWKTGLAGCFHLV